MEEEVIRRVRPHSTEAEQSVLCAMLMGDDAIAPAAEILHGNDFYNDSYGLVFDSLVELDNEGKTVDLTLLINKLREKGAPDAICNNQYLAQLMMPMAVSVNIREYAKIVAEKAVLRRLITASEEVENLCYKAEGSVDDILESAEKKMFNLFQAGNTKNIVNIREIVAEVYNQISEASMVKNHMTGIPSGFKDLDYRTAGFQKSDYVLIAARPSMGKTALALNIAQNVAFRQGKSVAIFSFEMPRQLIMNRLLSMESNIDSYNLRTGNLKDEEWGRLIDSAKVIGDSNLMIYDTSKAAPTVGTIRSCCRKHKLEHGLDIILVDFLQKMISDKRSESKQQEIAEISRQLKALAMELDVPVVVLSQLSRAVESRNDKRPMLSDLRESGAIEQDADVVMFIYRDEYYHKDSELKGIAEISIAKQRNGPVGQFNLAWLPQYTKFMTLDDGKK